MPVLSLDCLSDVKIWLRSFIVIARCSRILLTYLSTVSPVSSCGGGAAGVVTKHSCQRCRSKSLYATLFGGGSSVLCHLFQDLCFCLGFIWFSMFSFRISVFFCWKGRKAQLLLHVCAAEKSLTDEHTRCCLCMRISVGVLTGISLGS